MPATPEGERRSYPTPPPEGDPRSIRRARTLRRALLAILAVFVLLGAASLLGARTSTVSASGGGFDLKLVYPSVTRPGLAVRWILFVHRAGGFNAPLEVATSSTFFNAFDFNNLDPMPSEQTTTKDLSIWRFDPPSSDTLRITLDARVEPARQHGTIATTAILVDGRPVVSVHYQTRVMP